MLNRALPGPHAFHTCLGLSFFVLLLLAILFPHVLWALDIAQVKKGVVKITAQVEGKSKTGSGIIVKLEEDHAYIVTASHVIEGDQQPNVMFFSAPHRPFRARVLGLEGGNPAGLAALLIEGKIPPDLQALDLDQTTSISGGEAITLIGFPRLEGSLWTVTTGTLSGRRGSALSFAGVADEGNSGGPVLFQGKVVGIVTQVGAKFNSAAPAMLARFALEGWGVHLSDEASASPPDETEKAPKPSPTAPAVTGPKVAGEYQGLGSSASVAWSACKRTISNRERPSAVPMPTTRAISVQCKAMCKAMCSKGTPSLRRFKVYVVSLSQRWEGEERRFKAT